MKASDFIVECLIDNGVTDVYGYPGGMVTHLMDSFSKYEDQITAHITYHEQAAAFAACGYAQATGKIGVAYATSGPGATNLITGICNAYFDSTPVLFITGQVNTFESKQGYQVRQRGFQETNIIDMVRDVTKYAKKVESAEELEDNLMEAIEKALSDRKGPVLLDIPMNIFRADVQRNFKNITVKRESSNTLPRLKNVLTESMRKAKRPVIILGNGVKLAGATALARSVVNRCGIPTVSTMLAVDIINDKIINNGFLGAYGSRVANFVVAKSDLIIALGARLDVRQVGAKRENFAPNAKIIRVDIDPGELAYKVHDNEIGLEVDVLDVLAVLPEVVVEQGMHYEEWVSVCHEIQLKLEKSDELLPNQYMKKLGAIIPDDCIITTDVGQNQVWAAQSLQFKDNQKVVFSGGHGAMGFSLPAAIGCASLGKTVICLNGDGGIQMNIQELQTIVREKLPIHIVLFNNFALGMIRHFQEMYFENNFYQTTIDKGYTVPDFGAVAKAYGIQYYLVDNIEKLNEKIFLSENPSFVEIRMPQKTYVQPKLEFGKPNQDQQPLIDRKLYNYLMSL